MTETKLKNYLGMGIFIGQLSLVLLVLFSPFYGVDFPDAMSLLTVVAPILGAYAVIIVRYFTQHRYRMAATRDRSLSTVFVIIALVAPVCLYVTTVVVFLAYALGWWNVSVENTRFALTSVEGLFGIYLGFVVDALFKGRNVSSH